MKVGFSKEGAGVEGGLLGLVRKGRGRGGMGGLDFY